MSRFNRPIQAKYYPAVQAYNIAAGLSEFFPKQNMYPRTPPPSQRVRKRPLSDGSGIPFLDKQAKFIGPRNRTDISLANKNMRRSRGYSNFGVTNALAGRAIMKNTTKKLKSKKVKKVRVPKKLRKQIKQIMTGRNLTGKYISSRIGNIGIAAPTANPANFTVSNQTAKPAHFTLNTLNSTYNYSSWACPINSLNAAPTSDCTVAANYVAQDFMTYFHPAKFMDAAAVLWNGKAIASAGWLTAVGNINPRIDKTTGVEGVQTNPSGIRFTIVNSYVEFELKNCSSRQLTVRIYTCTPKIKLATSYPLDAGVAGVALDYAQNGPLYAEGTDTDFNNPLFNLRDCPVFNGQYTYQAQEIIIKGGETCKHSLQGPKNVEYDSEKFYINGVNGEQYNMRGTKSVIMQVMGDAQIATTTLVPGYYSEDTGPTNSYKCPITVHRTETFVLKCPETAGFIKNNLANGYPQNLNQKRRVIAYGNFASRNPATIAYTGRDEENPAQDIPQSFFM